MSEVQTIDDLLNLSPYEMGPDEKTPLLLTLFKSQLASACARHSGYGNLVKHHPGAVAEARSIDELPYVPVRVFKSNPPLSLVQENEIKRVMTSSATTGQIPSRIALDALTARRMSKGISTIVSNFIGKERRPYLVVDLPESGRAVDGSLGARGAAIRGLQPFATSVTYCLRQTSDGKLELDMEVLENFAREHGDGPVLVYGFTFLLYLHLVEPLRKQDISVALPNAFVLHSGGWKRLTERAVSKPVFNHDTATVLGINPSNVLDFYGMVENLGIVYPDCEAGNKHVPVFGEIVVRSPLTLEPVKVGESGIIQTCSLLPESFPGHLLLTEDLGRIVTQDGCECGRRGVAFQFSGRVPKAEVRGCGNVRARR